MNESKAAKYANFVLDHQKKCTVTTFIQCSWHKHTNLYIQFWAKKKEKKRKKIVGHVIASFHSIETNRKKLSWMKWIELNRIESSVNWYILWTMIYNNSFGICHHIQYTLITTTTTTDDQIQWQQQELGAWKMKWEKKINYIR